MDPKFQQLRAFSYVYRLRSLTKAADRMHLTQSAMSLLTKQLEEALGIRLFDRTSRALRPTEAGDEAIAVIERILNDVDYLKTSLRSLAEKRRGHVIFACTPTLASSVMPEVLKDFQRTNPYVEVTMRDATPDHLVDLVAGEQVEFGILTRGEKKSDIEFTTLLADHLCVICREDSPLATRARVTWKDVSRQPIIVMNGGSGLPEVIRQTLAGKQLTFKPAYDVAYLTTALGMTAHGLGVAIMPSHLIRGYPVQQKLVALKLYDPVVPRDLYVITRKGRVLSPAGESLVEQLSIQLRQPG